MLYKVIKTLLLGLGVGLSSLGWSEAPPETAEPLKIRYPFMGKEYGQTRSDYFLELLELALDRAGQDYQLEAVTLADFREGRSVMSVASGNYDIHWMNTTARREEILLPIRIPLYKGLIGWRVLLLREGDQETFPELQNLKELTTLRTVQGHDWPDSDILQHNGFNVIRAPNWEGMFRMLYAGRVDFFPRSVIEVWDEVDAFPDLNLAVEDEVVLVYPAAYYFFINRNNPELAEVIELGLNRAIADGSFDKVLMKHFGDSIERSNLKERRVIRMENPLATPETPLDRPELWYQP